jgi:anti-sigma regulatory factor (Ser/Thr protein kinase)
MDTLIGMEEETVQTQLPALASAPQLARTFLRATLETWELDGFGAVTELLASELVSNVVVHVKSPMTLRATRKPSTIRIEVEDPSPTLPQLQHADTSQPSGRGILIVDAFADEWGAESYQDHKVVWFELDVATGTAEAHDESG